MGKTNESIHIGHCIKQYMEAKGLTSVWLAKQLGCHRTNLYKIYEKPTIDTGILLRISRILNFNFFNLYEKSITNS